MAESLILPKHTLSNIELTRFSLLINQITTEEVTPTYKRKYAHSIKNPMRTTVMPRLSVWHSTCDSLERNHKTSEKIK